MSDQVTRRDWVKTVGVVGAGMLVAPNAVPPVPAPRIERVRTVYAPGDIVDLVSTSDVYTPARGRSFMRFSFDFPEPSVAFGDHRFGFLVFTEENTYALDRSRMRASGTGDALELTCDGFTWAGGQEKAPGKLTATFRRTGTTIEWDVVAEMSRPIKTVTTVIRDVPRGKIAVGGGAPIDPGEGDILAGYTFGATSMPAPTTPTVLTQSRLVT